MANIFTLEQKFATFLIEEGVELTFEHAVSRSEFLSQFPQEDFSSTRQMSYEPSRPLFHIIEIDHSVLDLSGPQDDQRMAYIHSNIEGIKSWFEAKHAEEHASEEVAPE